MRRVTVTVIDQNNVRRSALTSSLGFFSFDSLADGQTYTVTSLSKQYRFATLHITMNGDRTVVLNGQE